MEFTAKPEVLPPRTKRGGKLGGKLFDDENLDRVAIGAAHDGTGRFVVVDGCRHTPIIR